MIRIVRTLEAEPGKRQQVINVLKEISQYAATQDVDIRIFTEPWGNQQHVHMHTDFEDADAALGMLENVTSKPRGEEAVRRLEELTSGHVVSTFLTDQ